MRKLEPQESERERRESMPAFTITVIHRHEIRRATKASQTISIHTIHNSKATFT
uniref:Uncharacterized protein n=1 Tax=Anguilla anguilla TaxID=7936 RepID=A0A0E9UZM0_ANGAN